MTKPRFSVVIVSRDRPTDLRRCLEGLDQLFYPAFDVVVVGDAAAVSVVREKGAAHVRTVACDRANISAARNLGIAAAAGEIIAFIDDDAVPEPTWLDHLAAPFADAAVAAAGGFVLARNGVSFQWRARMVHRSGEARAILPWPVHDGAPRIFDAPADGAIKTEGTNMAVRRDVLVALGGFDEAFAFYLDETDLNLRLAQAGHRVALVPLAHVHHGFAPSPRRRRDRAPLSLFDIGASSAVFWSKHLAADQHPAARAALFAAQRARAERHLIAGTVSPAAFRDLMRSLEDGLEAGAARAPGQYSALGAAPAVQDNPRPRPQASHFLFGWRAARADLGRRARDLRADGHVVSVLILSRSALYHRSTFGEDGIWWQTGGLWGRSLRAAPLIRTWRLPDRVRFERARIAAVRGLENDADP